MFTVISRLIAILVLAAVVSGAWLFRDQLLERFREFRSGSSVAASPGSGQATAGALVRARDKVDSLNGWSADSILLHPSEMAAMIMAGLPPDARRHLDSLRVTLGDGSVRVRVRVETSQIPKGTLGPLTSALNAWEPVEAGGPVGNGRPGQGYWQVDHLALRGFDLPQSLAHQLVERGFQGSRDGQLLFRLPDGVASLRVRPTGVALYPAAPR